MTTTEWLEKAHANRQVLTNLILTWHPAGIEVKPFMSITAPAAEKACAVIRADEKKSLENLCVSLSTRVEEAFNTNDVAKLSELLSTTWFGVPESRDCWAIPGFAEACSLLDDGPEEDE